MTDTDSQLIDGIAVKRPSTLVEKAMHRLSDGPLTTSILARDVLFLRGNHRAASAAVFALLGTEPRVKVDSRGIWSLQNHTPNSASALLRQQEWAVVDVETTGGSIDRDHRVIEVGIVRVSGGVVGEEYSTLVNPGRRVPRVITSLTGIDQEMLDSAPRFPEVTEEISSALNGCVFVGHNAGFDWRFVSGEFERCTGSSLVGPRICTLRLAKRLLPHLHSRSLGSLAEYFGIEMERHHRALDDARATAHLLLYLIEMLEERDIQDWDQLGSFLKIRAKRRRPRRAIMTSADAA